MSESKTIEEILHHDIAVKVIAELSDEQKNRIIGEAVRRMLVKEVSSNWEIEKLLKEYALAYAYEYVQNEDIQAELKDQAIKAVDDVLKGVVSLIGREIEDGIKSRYVRIRSDKKYGE